MQPWAHASAFPFLANFQAKSEILPSASETRQKSLPKKAHEKRIARNAKEKARCKARCKSTHTALHAVLTRMQEETSEVGSTRPVQFKHATGHCNTASPWMIHGRQPGVPWPRGERESRGWKVHSHSLQYVKARSEGLGGGEGGGEWDRREREGGLRLGFRIGSLFDGESVLGVSRPLFSSRKGNALHDRLDSPSAFFLPPSRHPGPWRSLEGGNAAAASHHEPCRRAGHASRPCTRHRAGI